jgi:hypothetical protein
MRTRAPPPPPHTHTHSYVNVRREQILRGSTRHSYFPQRPIMDPTASASLRKSLEGSGLFRSLYIRRAGGIKDCLPIAINAPWYVSNRQIHEDLGIPFFANHIRALTESFDSKLADVGNPLVRQLGRHLCRPRAI